MGLYLIFFVKNHYFEPIRTI